jgi:hypothetical protein
MKPFMAIFLNEVLVTKGKCALNVLIVVTLAVLIKFLRIYGDNTACSSKTFGLIQIGNGHVGNLNADNTIQNMRL